MLLSFEIRIVSDTVRDLGIRYGSNLNFEKERSFETQIFRRVSESLLLFANVVSLHRKKIECAAAAAAVTVSGGRKLWR